jgi:hypothetical protein
MKEDNYIMVSILNFTLYNQIIYIAIILILDKILFSYIYNIQFNYDEYMSIYFYFYSLSILLS